MKILAIDTSCDETSVAVTRGVQVLSSVISSQVRYHRKFGGVVPMLAGRLHEERIGNVVELALQRAEMDISEIEAVAVTYGPGLAPALQVGVATARELAVKHGVPLYAVNHMAGHIASCFAVVGSRAASLADYPLLVLLVSGGHSELVYAEGFGAFTVIGQTLDDALGEAYDKVAKMLDLGYPGGRLVAKLAQKGDPTRYNLPVPMQKSGDLNLSYSGLKNAVRLLVADIKEKRGRQYLTEIEVANVAAAFEYVAQQSVLVKVERALGQYPEVRQLLLAGGVAANLALRAKLRRVARQAGIPLLVPANQKLCTDNAAMIGVAAYLGVQAGQQPVDPEKIDRVPSLSVEQTLEFLPGR